MSIRVVDDGQVCRLVFTGNLTTEFAREMEDRIIDALRRYTAFELDFAGVREIDACGMHLVGVVMSLGGDKVKVVSNLHLVEQAYEKFFASRRGPGSPGRRGNPPAVGARLPAG